MKYTYKTEEEQHKEALEINYALGNYGEKFCAQCGYLIEEFENIQEGICQDCIDFS